MTKLETLLELYKLQLKELMTKQPEYDRFIKFAAPLYKYSFSDAVLVYAQRPDATLCAEYDIWVDKLGLLKSCAGIVPKYNEEAAIGSIKGLTISLATTMGGRMFCLQGHHRYTTNAGEAGSGNITRIENKVKDVEEIYSSLGEQLEQLEANMRDAEEQLKVEFSGEAELADKQQRLIAITAEIDISMGAVNVETAQYTAPDETIMER